MIWCGVVLALLQLLCALSANMDVCFVCGVLCGVILCLVCCLCVFSCVLCDLSVWCCMVCVGVLCDCVYCYYCVKRVYVQSEMYYVMLYAMFCV